MSLDLKPVQVRVCPTCGTSLRKYLHCTDCWRIENPKPVVPGWQAFLFQRGNARTRKIAWELTFDEWWAIWQASGHWHERGSGRDLYCMARKGDIGPYSVGNVYICTVSQNGKDFRRDYGERHNVATRRGHLIKALSQRGWTRRNDKKSRRKPYQVVVGHKYIGCFATQEEAESAHRAAVLERLAT